MTPSRSALYKSSPMSKLSEVDEYTDQINPKAINAPKIKKWAGLDFPKKLVSIGVFLYFCYLKFKDMTWKDVWEGIASFCENVLFVPYDALRNLELDSWFLANTASWILMLVGATAFIYWMGQLKKFDEDTESHYTFDEKL